MATAVFWVLGATGAVAGERIQVRLWRTYFTAGDSVQIQAKITDADGIPTSKFIYIELLRDGSEIIEKRIKLKENGGVFAGYLGLPEELRHGWYTLRIYTRAQRNWPADALYHTRLLIRGRGKAPDGLLKSGGGTFIQADYPEEGEREYSQELTFRVKSTRSKLPKLFTITVISQDIGYYLSQEVEGDRGINAKEGQLFKISDIDYPDGTRFSVNVSGSRFIFPADEPEELAPPFDYGPTYPAEAEPKDTVTLQRFLAEALPESNDTITPSLVKVDRKASFYKPERVVGPYSAVFEWRQVRLREQIRKYDDIDLMTYIASQFPGLYCAESNNGRTMYTIHGGSATSRVEVSHGEAKYKNTAGHNAVALYINGFKEPDWQEAAIMTVRSIQNIYVLRGTEAALYKAAAVVLLETRRFDKDLQKGLRASERKTTIGLLPLGWK